MNKGYKQTEVGLIPSDWEVKKVGEIFTFYSTSNFSKAEMSLNGEVGCVHYGLIHAIENSHYSLSKGIKYYVTKEQAKYETIQEGDVIMVDASEDLVGLNKSVEVFNLNNKEYIAGLHTFHLRDINSNYVGTFRGLILNSNSVKKQMLRLAVGMKVFGVSKPQLQQVFVPVPPKSEQTAIATALSDADTLISSLEKLIAKKRNIKQGAMQQLLQPKEGWLHKSLEEVGLITGAGVDKTINEDEVPIRLVNYMDVFRRDFIYSNQLSHWVTTPAYKAQKCAVQKGDIFFTPSSEMRFDIAISAVAMEDIPDAAYSYHLVRLRLFEDWDLNFRTYIFKTKYFLDQAEQVCAGSGKRYVISLPKFRGLKIYIPPTKEEQTRIATILSDMDAEISALESKLEKYRKVKLGMMQELLTGKIRLI